jgi:hypothetical protein
MFICINTRHRFLLKEDSHLTNNGMNEPFNGAIWIFNEFLGLFDVVFLMLVEAGTVLR